MRKMTWQLITLMLYTVLTMDQADALERLCGRRLADALSLVCEGRGFYRLSETKRLDKSYDPPKLPRTFDLVNMYNAKVGGDGHLRKRRSIVDDCCFRTCSFGELERYCAPGNGQPIPEDLFGSSKVGQSESSPGQSGSPEQEALAQSGAVRNPSASRQKFQGTWNKPFFFVTPARREGLLDASDKRR